MTIKYKSIKSELHTPTVISGVTKDNQDERDTMFGFNTEDFAEYDKDQVSKFEYRIFKLVRFCDRKVETLYTFSHPFYQRFRKPDTYGVIQRIYFSDDLSLMLERLGDSFCNLYEIADRN